MQSVFSNRSRGNRGAWSLVLPSAFLCVALASSACNKSSSASTSSDSSAKVEKAATPAATERSTEATGATVLLPPGMEKSTTKAADFPTAKIMTTGLKVDDDSVTVGILHSTTGTMAISETGSVQAEKLAIAQINALGGILGRQIKVIQEDGASDWPTFAEKARKLLVNDKVAAVMGCWTSASRKAVLPVFEKENGLLYYPTFYEGLEQSKNVFYTGQEATQQILASLDWVK